MINSDYFPISNWKKFNSDLVDEIQIKLEERLEDFKEDGWKMGISCIEKALKKLKD